MNNGNPYLNAYRQQMAIQNAVAAKQQAAQPQAQPQQQGGGGLVGFLQNAGRSIGQSYDYLGHGLANVLDEVTGGAQQQRDLQSKTQQQDVATIKSIGQRLRATSDPAEKQRLQTQLRTVMNLGDQQDKAFQQRQSEIIQQNDPLKGAASVGSIGLDVLSGGAGSQLLKGGLRQAIVSGAKQGAVFGGAQGALQPIKDNGGNATAQDILGNAASGAGVGALGGAAAGGIGRLASSALPGGKVNALVTGNPANQAISDVTRAANPSKFNAARSAVADKGLQMETNAGGFGIGEKQAGKAPLDYYGSQNVLQDLRSEGIKPGSSRAQLKATEDTLNQRGQTIDSLINQNNTSLNATARRGVISDYKSALSNTPGLTPSGQKYAAGLMKDFNSQVTDAKSLIDFRRKLDQNVIAYNRNPDAALVDRQVVARALRDTLANKTNELVPGIADANRSYSKLINAKDYLVNGNKVVTDQSQGQGASSFVNRVLSNGTAEGIKSRTGALLQKAAPNVVDQAATGVAAPTNRGDFARSLLGAGITDVNARGAGAAQPDQSQPQQAIDPTRDPSLQDLSGGAIDQTQTDPLAGFGVTMDEAQQALVQAARDGNTKGVQNAQALLSAMQAAQKASPTSTGPNIGKPSAQAYSYAKSGLGALSQLQALINKDPSIVTKSGAIPGQDLPVIGGVISNVAGTGVYNNLSQNVIDAIARARTGAAMTASEEAFYKRMLPQPGDSSQTISSKIAQLQQAFVPFLGQNGGSTSDLADILSQAGQ